MKIFHGKLLAALIPLLFGFGAIGRCGEPPTRPEQLPPPPALHPVVVPTPETYQLDNGMRVMLLEDHEIPLVSGSLWIHTGSQYDPADKTGLAEMTASLMRTGGTAEHSGDELDDILESSAIQMSVNMDVGAAQATFSCLSGDLDKTLHLFGQMLEKPRFDPDKLEVLRGQMKTEVLRRNDSISDIANREYTKLVFGPEAPRARYPELYTLDAIQRQDIVGFHAAQFRPDGMILGIWGDFDSAAMKKLIADAFGGWKVEGGAPNAVTTPSPPKGPSVSFVEKSDTNQSTIMMGQAFPITRSDPDYHAMVVASQILSGGFTGRLVNKVRVEAGLAYSVGGYFIWQWDRPGDFRAQCQTKSSTTLAAIDLIDKVLADMRSGPPTEDELNAAKDALLNSYAFNLDTKGEIMNRLLTYAYYGYPMDFMERYRQGIQKVTADDVLRVCKKWLHPDALHLLVVGKKSDLDGDLSRYGKVNTIDTTIPRKPKPTVDENSPAPAQPVPSSGKPKTAATTDGEPEAHTADAASRENGKKLLDAVVKAAGGEKLLALESLAWDATDSRLINGVPRDRRIHAFVVFPDTLKIEYDQQGTHVAICIHGDSGWQQYGKRVADIPASMVSYVRLGMSVSTTPMLREAAHADAVELEPTSVDGVTYKTLQLTRQGFPPVTFLIDPETMRVARRRVTLESPQNGTRHREEVMSDYRSVDGIWLPFTRITFENGEKSIISVLRYELDPPHDEKSLQKPESGGS